MLLPKLPSSVEGDALALDEVVAVRPLGPYVRHLPLEIHISPLTDAAITAAFHEVVDVAGALSPLVPIPAAAILLPLLQFFYLLFQGLIGLLCWLKLIVFFP